MISAQNFYLIPPASPKHSVYQYNTYTEEMANLLH
jgi:hypothetical protein